MKKKASICDSLPKQLRIGPYNYPIQVMDGDLVDSDGKTDEDAVGMHLWGAHIQIKRTQHNDVFAADTVLHEIFHALYKNLAVDHFTSEESLVSAFATGLTQVLMDSPELRSWLETALSNGKARR